MAYQANGQCGRKGFTLKPFYGVKNTMTVLIVSLQTNLGGGLVVKMVREVPTSL